MVLPAKPIISVIIPTLNEGDWLERTVTAVLTTIGDHHVELIIVDDGSIDNSNGFLTTGIRNCKVKLIHGTGLGCHRARNLGASQSMGEILVFLDAHVLPDAGWLDEMVALLSDPSVGLTSLAIRSYDAPKNIGYGYIFVDEHLRGGWLKKQSDSPFESPCVCGCCIGVRKQVFWHLLGYDDGAKRWGVEDKDISIRAWLSGYRCVISPALTITHLFKTRATRKFSVAEDDYTFNLLRCILTCFSDERQKLLLAGIRHRKGFDKCYQEVQIDPQFWQRRQKIQSGFLYKDTWFLEKFSTGLTKFLKRLEELGKKA